MFAGNRFYPEARYMTVLRGLVYIATVALLVAPLDAVLARVAALLAVPIALALTRWPVVHRVRGPFLVLGTMAVAALGTVFGWVLGHSNAIASLAGFRSTLALSGVLTFGATTFAIVFGLRMLAIRFRAMSFFEAATVILVVVAIFAGHRDGKIGQPRYLADWSFSRGHDPGLVLLAVGVAAMGAVAVLLLQHMRLRQAVAAIVVLLLLGGGGFLALWKYLPEVGASPPPPKSKTEKNGGSEADDKYDYPGLGPNPKSEPKPLAIVTLQDDYDPPEGRFYFRDNAFSVLHANRLARPKQGNDDPDVPTRFPDTQLDIDVGLAASQFVKLPAVISLLMQHEHPFGLVTMQSLEPRTNPNPKKFVRSFATVSLAPKLPLTHSEILRKKAGNPAWPTHVRDQYLAIPNDPRYRQLADEIVAASVDDSKLKPEYQRSPGLYALALKRWLEKNITYTKTGSELSEHLHAADPTASFLFGNRHGKCTNIAQALTILLRAKGIPARMAGGYAVEASRRGQGSSLLLQDTDLHAWCEIYLQDMGWVVIDVAVEQSKDPPPPQPDADQQRHLGNENRKQELPEELQQDAEQPPRRLGAWAMSIVIPLLLVLATLYGIKAWRRVVPRIGSQRQLHRLSYRSTLDRLSEVGLNRQFGETREEFAQRVARWAPEFAEMTAAHVRTAVTGNVADDRNRWLDRQTQVIRHIIATFPRYRRILGLLNPIAWLWTR